MIIFFEIPIAFFLILILGILGIKIATILNIVGIIGLIIGAFFCIASDDSKFAGFLLFVLPNAIFFILAKIAGNMQLYDLIVKLF